MSMPRPFKPTLKRARALRKSMPSAEAKLWSALRRDQLGVRFRRQHPVGRYIADFACFPLRLIVEIDGATHWSPVQRAHDARRTDYLEQRGWHILRFTNEAVFRELDDVLAEIAKALHDLRPPPSPSGTPPPRGRRAPPRFA